jgi:hypothetical protein
LARECADKPNDDEFKKKMWLRIARHVIEKDNNVKKAIEFLRFTDQIKLEDILPFFPDFVLIDDFKDEICTSLEAYKTDIEELKTDMHEATQNAKEIRDDIKTLKHRFGYITPNAKCDSQHCFKSILSKDFYLFPCQHVFHASCLIDEVSQHVGEQRRTRINHLDNKRQNISKVPSFLEGFATAVGVYEGASGMTAEESKELDDLIANECPYCGEIMISSIDALFVDNQHEMDSWEIPNYLD